MKAFRIPGDQIRDLARGHGACIASDRILVDGLKVGYCYREAPDHDVDSGWRFFAGDEDQDSADDPRNFALYDINTIANYDPEIVILLDEQAPCAFERDANGRFVRVDFPDSKN